MPPTPAWEIVPRYIEDETEQEMAFRASWPPLDGTCEFHKEQKQVLILVTTKEKQKKKKKKKINPALPLAMSNCFQPGDFPRGIKYSNNPFRPRPF